MNITDLLRASLESEGVDLELNNTEQEQIITDDTAVAIDEALNEVADTAATVKQNEEAIDELEKASTALESLVTHMEATIPDGGMTRQSAQFQLVALENVCAGLPVRLAGYSVAAESFGGDQDRLVATQESIEGAKKLLAGLWQALKDLVSKAYEAVKNFFATIGNGSKALKRGAQILKDKAKGMEKNGEFDATSYAKAMHIEGKFDGVSTIEAGFKAYREASAGELDVRKACYETLINLAALNLANASADPNKLFDESADELEKMVGGPSEDAAKLRFVSLPGGKAYQFKIFAIGQSKVSTFSGDAKVSVSKGDVEKLAGDVITFASFLEKAAVDAKKVSEEMNRVVDQLKKDVGASEDKATFAKQKLGLASRGLKFGLRNLTGVPGGAAAFAKQTLAFGAKAVAAAGGKAAEKADDKAAAAA